MAQFSSQWTPLQTSEALQHYHHQQLQSLLTHVWQHAPFYRELYQQHGLREQDLPHVTLHDLPFASKAMVQENFDAVVTDPRLRKHELDQWLQGHPDPRETWYDEYIVTQSSGSTRVPGITVYDLATWEMINTALAARFHDLPRLSSGKIRLASYMQLEGNYGGIITVKRVPSAVYEVRNLSILDLSERVIEELNTFQPHRLTGFASSIITLAEWALQGHLHIAPQMVTVAGDPLTASMRQTMEAAWDTDLHDIYTASEARYLAVQGPNQNEMTVLDELYIVEILDEHNRPVAPGEIGRVVVTSLVNRTQPILRYALGDNAICGGEPGDIANTKIRQVIGRVDDRLPICLDSGRLDVLNPHSLDAVLKNHAVQKLQFVSHRPEHIRLDYIADANLDTGIRATFQHILESKGAAATTFDVCRVEQIAVDPQSGKHRMVRIEGKHASPTPIALPRSRKEMRRHDRRPTTPFDPFPRHAIEQSIPTRFEQIAQRFPTRLAIQTSEQFLTYAALNQSANGLAHTLLQQDHTREAPIALLCDEHVLSVTAILGILKSGHAYIPLDHGASAPQLKTVLKEAGVRLILATTSHQSLAAASAPIGSEVINLNTAEALSGQLENPSHALSADTLACVMYTSGTTGQPKGVMQSHRNVLHRIMTYTNDLHVGVNDRLTLLHGYSSSASLRHLFAALLTGATLYPYDLLIDGLSTFTDWLRQYELTLCHLPASVFRAWGHTLQSTDVFPHVRVLYVANEPVAKQDIDIYHAHFADSCLFVNALVASETATICQYVLDQEAMVTADGVPVGYAAQDKEVLLLDDDGQEVGPQSEGEIAVRSRHLAVGYWRQPELTQVAFESVTPGNEERLYRTGDVGRMLPDGRLFHLGRKDGQVKIRGYRVELAEVENAIHALDAVQDAVVVAQESPSGESQLVAYAVPHGQPEVSAIDLRSALTGTLPNYAIPSQIVMLATLPRTPNGKVDRRALPVPTSLGALARDRPFIAPRTPIETQLADFWTEVLDCEAVSMNDAFADLGGHSLSAARLLVRVQQTFNVHLTTQLLMGDFTVADMALMIVECLVEQDE